MYRKSEWIMYAKICFIITLWTQSVVFNVIYSLVLRHMASIYYFTICEIVFHFLCSFVCACSVRGHQAGNGLKPKVNKFMCNQIEPPFTHTHPTYCALSESVVAYFWSIIHTKGITLDMMMRVKKDTWTCKQKCRDNFDALDG